jgi:acetaldehyde dehydrogenase/alcohol dehydrogenase
MKKEEARTPVDSVESLERALARLREAQKTFSTYSQEQVDAIFLAAASAADKGHGRRRRQSHQKSLRQ